MMDMVRLENLKYVMTGGRERVRQRRICGHAELMLNWWVRRVVGTICNVGAGDPSSLPVRNAN